MARTLKQISAVKKKAFLAEFAKTGNVSKSAEKAKVDRQTAKNWKKSDPVFAAAWDDAVEQYAEYLESVADNRAVGWEEPILDKDGNVVGHRQKSSDLLLIFRLKGVLPEKYKDRAETNTNLAITTPLAININREKS